MDNTPEVTRAQMDDTRAALSEKLGTLEQRMVDTVHGAANAVAQTVDHVKDTVHDTMENVKDTFDLRHQVERHPWAMVGGSIALGFVGGYLLLRHGATQPAANGTGPHMPVDRLSIAAPPNGGDAAVHHPFATEITKLKKLAIGTLLSIVRDAITKPAPASLQTGLTEVIDGITVQLGGEPIRGPVLKTAATTT